MLKKHPYHKGSTLEKVKAIEDSVQPYPLDKRIILLKGLKEASPFAINISYDKIEQLTKDIPAFAIVVDISDSSIPDAPSRKTLKARIERIAPKLVYSAVFIGKNALISYMLKIISIGLRKKTPYAIASSQEEAIQKALQKLNAHQNSLPHKT